MTLSSTLRRLLGLALLTALAPVHAQSFPEKPITLVVGFSPGGGVDTVGRIMAELLGANLPGTVVVDNRTGFSGNLAAQQVKRAAPDGYTLLMAPTTSYAMSVKLLGAAAAGYELVPDFKAVATVAELPLVLLASKTSGVATLEQMTRAVKAAPGKLAYGSAGNGSTEHVVTEAFRLQTGLEMIHVPYRGSSPAMADLQSGQIQYLFTTPPTALANVQGGRAVAVGTANRTRLGVLPDVPTFAEQGLPFEAASIYAILAPKATPDAVVARLNAALGVALKTPEARRRLAQVGVEVIVASPAESAQRLAAEVDKWSRAIDAARIKQE
ncbi:MAG: tripartite tricarboxylate transporter substrate binding protein [Rubrivivax sp.]|jgi:tripartite-type tricarboxylate transporter receptor subunit TctC|nr:tripartite tricarboxylate transporter substrate binding protein [Rubrivivax sp.]